MMSSLFVGFGALRANPLRTFLSTLGVVIGVASLVAILSVTEGLERFSREQIEKTTDLQMIQVVPLTSDAIDGVRIRRETVMELSLSDLDSLSATLGEKAHATLVCNGSGWLTIPGDTVRIPAMITATLPGADRLFDAKMRQGRWFTREDLSVSQNLMIVSAGAAKRLAKGDTTASFLGKRVEAMGMPFTIIGVAEGGGDEQVARVSIPLVERFRPLLGSAVDRPVNLMVKVVSVEEGESVRKTLESWLTERFGPLEKNFVVSSSRQRIAQVAQAMLVFKLVMGAITGISLIVGGIGIMNILLASVSERTREIGIRRAAGARASEIRLQFLAEAVTISGFGSFVGVIVGYVGSLLITAIIRNFTEAPFYTAFAWSSVVVAVVAAFVIGLTFGLYPARKASKLDPAEAIRYE